MTFELPGWKNLNVTKEGKKEHKKIAIEWSVLYIYTCIYLYIHICLFNIYIYAFFFLRFISFKEREIEL